MHNFDVIYTTSLLHFTGTDSKSQPKFHIRWKRLTTTFPNFIPKIEISLKILRFLNTPDLSPKFAEIPNLGEITQKWERCRSFQLSWNVWIVLQLEKSLPSSFVAWEKTFYYSNRRKYVVFDMSIEQQNRDLREDLLKLHNIANPDINAWKCLKITVKGASFPENVTKPILDL